MDFLFTQENRNIQILKGEWIAGDSFGAYMLVGKSGSGKTAFLQHLDTEWKSISQEEMMTWIHVEELIVALLAENDVFDNIQTPVLVLENMEDLIGKENTLNLFWDLLKGWLHDKERLFIGVTNNENIMIPNDVTVVYNQGIKITPMVVSYVAKKQNIYLHEDRIDSLCIESGDSISKLIGLIKRESLFA